MTIRSTSLSAYRDIESDGTLGAQEKTILMSMHAAYRPGMDFTLQELVTLTGIAINAVSGRVNGLKNNAPKYLIECTKRRCSITGRMVTPVSLRYPKAQRELFAA